MTTMSRSVGVVRLGLAALALLCGLSQASAEPPKGEGPAKTQPSAGEPAPAATGGSFKEIIDAARAALAAEQARDKAREDAFLKAEERQAEMLAEAKARKEALEAEIAAIEARFRDQETAIADGKKGLEEKLGAFASIMDALRQFSAEIAGQIDVAPTGLQHPDRIEVLRKIAGSERLVDPETLSRIWVILLEELADQSRIESFEAPITATDGRETSGRVTRIGAFSIVSNGAFLNYDPGAKRLIELSRQPIRKFTKAAAEIESASGDGIVTAAIDPAQGAILQLLVQTPSLEERVHQGGIVGYVILGLGAFGVLVALVKIIALRVVAAKVGWQQRRIDRPSRGNPLGRVLLAIDSLATGDRDAIDRKLDEAVMRETPKLERGLPLVKLLAAIAPLLGLLGTVVGMIVTFQSITLFGTGDPKLMAGGISQALVTTVLGLVTAIPLLLLHSMAAGTAGRINDILEQQAAGLIAQRLDEGSEPYGAPPMAAMNGGQMAPAHV